MSEPLYDLSTRTWSHTCPCIRQMQVDPDCRYHGRPEFRDEPCTNCEATIRRDPEGTWLHLGTSNLFCPGGEPFGEMATPGDGARRADE